MLLFIGSLLTGLEFEVIPSTERAFNLWVRKDNCQDR